MPRKKNDVEAGLRKKGFVLTEGDHHYFHYVNLQGKKTLIRTKTSHTPKMRDIPDQLISQMAKQCHVTKQDFLNLVDCPLNQKGFEQKAFAK